MFSFVNTCNNLLSPSNWTLEPKFLFFQVTSSPGLTRLLEIPPDDPGLEPSPLAMEASLGPVPILLIGSLNLFTPETQLHANQLWGGWKLFRMITPIVYVPNPSSLTLSHSLFVSLSFISLFLYLSNGEDVVMRYICNPHTHTHTRTSVHTHTQTQSLGRTPESQ